MIKLLIPYTKKCISILPTFVISMVFYSQHSLADNLMSQCILGIPSYNRPLVQGNANQLPITIHSDNVRIHYPNDTAFTGKVNIQQGNIRLLADEVYLHQSQHPEQPMPIRTIDALGHVHYDDNQIIMQGSKMWLNLDTKDINVWDGKYQMVGRQGRGTANQIKLRGNNCYIVLKNGMFTSCLPGNNSWSIVGSKVIQDYEKQVVKIWNARFKIGHIPIFYSPYLQLSIGDYRQSGLLIPNVKYSNNYGFQFMLPWYWHAIPQMDATVMLNYLSKRGLQLQNEFCYMSQDSTSLVEFDYLLHDKQYKHNKAVHNLNKSNSHLWLFFWQSAGIYRQHWRFKVDYTKVSDHYYFHDLNSKYLSTRDGYAPQQYNVSYVDTNWNTTLFSKDFQIFGNCSKDIYRAQPQLNFNYYKNNIGPFNAHFYAQVAYFTNVNYKLPNAVRLHLEPTIGLPLANNWVKLNTEAKLLATYYHQSNIDYYNSLKKNVNNLLKKNVSRVITQLKVNGRMVFNRIMCSANGYTQTLEPSLQYLYIPYRDQSYIMAYDAILLQNDYIGLFRNHIYSGLDRIASANKIAGGLVTRIYDSNLVERLNLSIGQIYSLVPPCTGLNGASNRNATSNLIWAGNSYWCFDDHWGIRGDLQLQHDTHLYRVTQSNVVLEYRRDTNRMMQLNYRYSSPEYIANTLNNKASNKIIYKNNISQIGMTANWPFTDSWKVIGAYYYNTKSKQFTDQSLGLQYSSCCYAIRIDCKRKIHDWEKDNSKYDNQIAFNIELRGLNQNYSLRSNQMLRRGIVPYQCAF